MTTLTKRIPVSEPVWKDLAELRMAGQTYDDILIEMIELQKKQRLADDIRRSLEEDDFIPLSEAGHAKSKSGTAKVRARVKVVRNERPDIPAA
jgi:predicted CopG family antitoxin